MDRATRNFNMTDAEIANAFNGTDFGSRDKRSLLVRFVLKGIVGYHRGSTLNCIARELRLITAKGNITKKGKMFMYNNLCHCKITGQPEED